MARSCNRVGADSMTALHEATGSDYDPTRPRQGRSVARSVAPLACDMISAVMELQRIIPHTLRLEWLTEGSRRDQIHHPDSSGRQAWAIAAITCIHAFLKSSSARCSVALNWFGDATAAEQLERL